MSLWRNSKGSRRLRIWMRTKSWSSISFSLSFLLVNDGSLIALSLHWVPAFYLVIVTRGVDVALIKSKTPYFTVVVGLHISNLLAIRNIAFYDRTISKSNYEAITHGINSSRKISEVKGLSAFVSSGVGDAYSTISTTGVDLTGIPGDGTNETFLMDTDGLGAGSSLNDINQWVGSTCISGRLIISTNTSKWGSWARSIETLALSFLLGPLSVMLNTSSPKLVLALFFGKAHIKDFVSATLVRKDLFHSAATNVPHDYIVVIVLIGSCTVFTIWWNTDGCNSSGTLDMFSSWDNFTGLSIPGKYTWWFSNLTSYSGTSISSVVYFQAHDIVVVMFGVTGNLFRSVLNLTTTKESLGVGVLVQDYTETSGHVGDVTIWVIKDILSWILASITIGILKSIGGIRFFLVYLWVIIWLNDSTDPRLYC